MKLVLTCHTEYDLKNRYGSALKLPAEKQSFNHLTILRDMVNEAGLPLTWAFMVGGPCQERLIKFIAAEKKQWEKNSEFAIHFHSERFREGQWVFEGFLKPEEYEVYWQAFLKYLAYSPKSVIFGKWKIDRLVFRKFREWAIDHEGTALFPEKMITGPFIQDGMVKVPLVMAFDKKPINPFTQISHWLYLNKIIKKLHGNNLLFHIGIHSYDLFDFNGPAPKLKGQKVMVWKNLVGLIKRYGIEVITLSEVEPSGWEESGYLRPGLFSILFNRLRH